MNCENLHNMTDAVGNSSEKTARAKLHRLFNDSAVDKCYSHSFLKTCNDILVLNKLVCTVRNL